VRTQVFAPPLLIDMRNYPTITITEKAERSAKAGHPWVYADEITGEKGEIADGALVDVYSKKERYIGTGFFNSHSKIRVRIISTNANDRFDTAFYERRIRYALDYRKTVMGEDFHACRLIFGEADMFPGLTVDLFEDILSVQVLSLGVDLIIDTLLDILVDMLPDYGVTVRGVYLRNDVAIRELEGLGQFTGYWKPERFPDIDPSGTVIIT